ncbi:MAG: SoxR reducing system RseC family protein [Bacteroidales bacterium]|nr:SoxR reducing system RseC family protein [Bacteroidales bacterium]
MVDQEVIRHTGKIVDFTPEKITVEIVSEAACASCRAAQMCGMSESKTKIVEVPAQLGFEPGEEVWVIMKKSMGTKAVTVGYVFPLIALVLVLIACLLAGLPELVAGLAGIMGVGMYYFMIWLLRDNLRDTYTFYIKKK